MKKKERVSSVLRLKGCFIWGVVYWSWSCDICVLEPHSPVRGVCGGVGCVWGGRGGGAQNEVAVEWKLVDYPQEEAGVIVLSILLWYLS